MKEGRLTTGHDRLNETLRRAKGREHFRRFKHAEPATRTSADEDDPSAEPKRLRD